MKKVVKIWVIIIILLILASCIILYCSTKKDKSINETNTQIANPASVYCIDNGGELELRTDKTGGQYGVCIKDGKECEEWAFFRGECEL